MPGGSILWSLRCAARDAGLAGWPGSNPPGGPVSETIRILPWPDPVIDTLGHDPRAPYPERFWLPTLGPTALLLIRHIAHRFDRAPEGFTLDLGEVSRCL